MQQNKVGQEETIAVREDIQTKLESEIRNFYSQPLNISSKTGEKKPENYDIPTMIKSKDFTNLEGLYADIKANQLKALSLIKAIEKFFLMDQQKLMPYLKLLICLNEDEKIYTIFKQLSMKDITNEDTTYYFELMNDYEDSIFVLSDYFSRNQETLYKFLGKTVEKEIIALYPVFSLSLHTLSKNFQIDDAEMLLKFMFSNQLEISTCAINNLIDALCKNNQLENAQKIIKLIAPYVPEYIFPAENFKFQKYVAGRGINIVTYGTFIKYICKSGNMKLALYYYNRLKDEKLLSDEIIFNLVIDGCSKNGDLETLKKIYNDMLKMKIKPTIVTFNTIIDAYVRSNDVFSAWKIFDDLLRNDITPDNFTLSTLFRGIRHPSHKKYLDRGLEIVEEIAKSKNTENKIDVILINVLLDSCAILKERKLICQLFNDVICGKFVGVEPDLITYNTFIKGCAQMNLYNEVMSAFEHLLRNPKIQPNDVTFNTLIDAVVRNKDMDQIWSIISKMEKMGIKPDNFTYSTIIKGINKNSFEDNSKYSKNNKLDFAFELFNRVKKDSQPDEILYNCIMDACLRFGEYNKMLKLYENMQQENIKPSSITCGIIIKGYGLKGDIDSAINVYNFMKEEHIEITSVTYGCLINACIKNECLSKAFYFFEEIKKNGLEMNTILYTTLIKAYIKNKSMDKVINIFEEMKKFPNSYPNNITYNSVIDCCLKCNKYKLADQIFEELLNNKNVRPDIITFSTLIKGYLKNGNFEKAIYYFELMMNLGIKPDDVFLNSLLDGCEKMQQYQKAIEIYNTIISQGIKPTMMSFSIMMKILGRLNNFELSKKLFESAKQNILNLSLVIFTCYIKTCLTTEHLEEAVQTFLDLKKFNFEPDQIAFATIISGFINYNGNIPKEYFNKIISISKSSIISNNAPKKHIFIALVNFLKKFGYVDDANEIEKMVENYLKFNLNENTETISENKQKNNYGNFVEKNKYDHQSNYSQKYTNYSGSYYKKNRYYNNYNYNYNYNKHYGQKSNNYDFRNISDYSTSMKENSEKREPISSLWEKENKSENINDIKLNVNAKSWFSKKTNSSSVNNFKNYNMFDNHNVSKFIVDSNDKVFNKNVNEEE